MGRVKPLSRLFGGLHIDWQKRDSIIYCKWYPAHLPDRQDERLQAHDLRRISVNPAEQKALYLPRKVGEMAQSADRKGIQFLEDRLTIDIHWVLTGIATACATVVSADGTASLQNSHSPVQIWPVPPNLVYTIDANDEKLHFGVHYFCFTEFWMDNCWLNQGKMWTRISVIS